MCDSGIEDLLRIEWYTYKSARQCPMIRVLANRRGEPVLIRNKCVHKESLG